MKDQCVNLTEFENLLRSFQRDPTLDMKRCLLQRFSTPDNLVRFMGFCQAIFRLDAEVYHRDFAVEVMATSGLALSDLTRDQTMQWCRESESKPRIHTSGYLRVVPGAFPVPEVKSSVCPTIGDTVDGTKPSPVYPDPHNEAPI